MAADEGTDDAGGSRPQGDEGRSPVDHVIDYCVYAPLGFALEARRLMPGLIDRGKAQVGVARMVGEFAVRWGSTRVEAAVVDAQDQAMGLLRRTGLAPDEERERGAGPGPSADERAPEPEPAAPAEGGPGEAPAEDAGPSVDVATLAIPDYDNLSASQVVPRLDGLAPDELEAVRRYERANRGRKTILNKVAQLQDPEGPPPEA